METATCDLVVIGAGPYALAAVEALRNTTSLDVRVFGRPMSFWSEHMPRGMLLRSPNCATHLGNPTGPNNLDAFARATKADVQAPLPLSTFLAYGRWVQQRVAPDLDDRYVKAVERETGYFVLTLEDGARVTASRVVVATGIARFAHVPVLFRDLAADRASHTSEHQDLGIFQGRRVLVVGGGQSALESAALLHEAEADVELLVRNDTLHWLHGNTRRQPMRWVANAMSGPSEIGPPGISRLVEVPRAFVAVPDSLQRRLHKRAIRPAGAKWLRPRIEGVVPVRMSTAIQSVEETSDAVFVSLGDGTKLEADHALLGTGYRVDVTRHPFLSDAVVSSLNCVDGYPPLGPGFESSVPGLHFLGAPAALSYGPLMRFVAGTGYASAALAAFCRRNASPTVVAA
jgi:cation diffusion facilitator CzcD-associated flavoprotein CzcO